MLEKRYLRKNKSLRKSHLYSVVQLKLNQKLKDCLELRQPQLQVEVSSAVIHQHKGACLNQTRQLAIPQVTCLETNHLTITHQLKVGCLDLSLLKVIPQHQEAYSGLNPQEVLYLAITLQQLRITIQGAYLEEINLQQDLYLVLQ